MSTHSRLSPSAASRWMTCPGSVRLTEHLPRTSSEFAAEGTCAHSLAEMCLTNGEEPHKHIGLMLEADGYWFEVTHEMADAVKVYTDLVRSTALGATLFIEQRVDLSPIYGEQGGGTADAIVYNKDERILYLIDLKYGRGEEVAATTPQLKVYMLGAIDKLGLLAEDVDKCVAIIVQPRIHHIDRAEYTYQELMVFADEVSKAAAATRDPDAPLVASEKACRWCGIKNTCVERAKAALSVPSLFPVAEVEAVSVQPADLWQPHSLTDEQLASVYTKLPMLEDWIKSISDEIHARLENGKPVPGWKMVEGRRGNKSWKDEDAVAEELVEMGVNPDKIWKKKMASPSEVEKLIGKVAASHLAEHVYQAAGKPIVVPETDKRPALESRSLFKALS